MSRDQWERHGTAAAVLIVDAIAATVSFIHIQHLAATHGQTRLAAILLPLSIDGTVAASSLVLLRSARAGTPAPWLGQAMLASAVIATLAANVGYGWAWGPVGAAISGWPAYAFIGCTEMAILMVRRTAGRAGARAVSPPVFTDAQTAALTFYKGTVAAGNPLSQNKLADQFRLSRAEARDVIKKEASNGQQEQRGEVDQADRAERQGLRPRQQGQPEQQEERQVAAVAARAPLNGGPRG